MGNIKVNGKNIQAVVKLGSKDLERYNAIADELKNFTLPEEMVKIFDEYSVKSTEELDKLPTGKYCFNCIIDRYPSGKSKYEIDIHDKTLYMIDEKTGNIIKDLEKGLYCERDPQNPDRYRKWIYMEKGKPTGTKSQEIAWNSNNKVTEEVKYSPSNGNSLIKSIYDKDGNKLYRIVYKLSTGEFWFAT